MKHRQRDDHSARLWYRKDIRGGSRAGSDHQQTQTYHVGGKAWWLTLRNPKVRRRTCPFKVSRLLTGKGGLWAHPSSSRGPSPLLHYICYSIISLGVSLPEKLVAQVMLRLKFLEALINMSKSLFCWWEMHMIRKRLTLSRFLGHSDKQVLLFSTILISDDLMSQEELVLI